MKIIFGFTFACGLVGLIWSIECTSLSEIPCPYMEKCIYYYSYCNQRMDCSDGSDEHNCGWSRYDGYDSRRKNILEQKGLRIEAGILKCIRSGYNYTRTLNYCKDLINQYVILQDPQQFCFKHVSCGTVIPQDNRDVDECENKPCSDYCLNTEGSFQCLCQTGYQVQNVINCTDVDECQKKPCSHICTNFAGGFACSCQNGYLLADDTSSCIDIDECSNSSMNNCEQICLNNQGSFSCTCHNGYLLAENGTACNDIDECLEIPRVCSQTCVNNVGNYTCECIRGYEIQEQSSCCKAKEGNTKAFYVTENNDIILRIVGTDDRFNLTRRANVVLKRFLYLASSQVILFLETYSKGGAVWSLPLGQTPNKPVILLHIAGGNPGDMAIDIVTKKLYVTDSELSAVVVYDMFNASRRTSLNIIADLPSTIVLDSKDRFFYYANLGERHRGIYKSPMDGDDSVPFVTTDVRHTSDMFLDETTAVLYWADSVLNKIEMVSLDGKIRKVLLSSSSNPLFKQPLSISVFEDNIYWSQINSFDVYSTNKRTYDETNKIASENINVLKILVTGSHDTNFAPSNNSCMVNTCDQMCLLGPDNSSKCVCFTGYSMNDNETLCTLTSQMLEEGKNVTIGGVNNKSTLEHEEKIDYESLKQTVEVNLLRTLVEKTENIVQRIEKFKISKDSQ